MALTSLAGKRTKTGTEDRANAGLHFSTRKPGYTKTNKQTNISAGSAVSTAKSSPKEKRRRKSNLLQHDDRFRFRLPKRDDGQILQPAGVHRGAPRRRRVGERKKESDPLSAFTEVKLALTCKPVSLSQECETRPAHRARGGQGLPPGLKTSLETRRNQRPDGH
ncbi:uncharacterized protein M6G45_002974 [Spheniscus humboldti]